MVIQKDLFDLFDYVEPSDKNHQCYSYRIHELLMRVCIEVEANCKAILVDNGYTRAGNWNIADYQKLNVTHRLSSYTVKYPVWNGISNVLVPFAWWKAGPSLTWYQAYNAAKHDRHQEFEEANFKNVTEAVAGLVVLLASQFYTYDYSGRPTDYYDDIDAPTDAFERAIGDYFLVKFPDDWPIAERYEFDWDKMRNDADPFQILQF
jgi:hypothetical protein